ncbi:MAG TPA: HypC/HybG/HupF family hydrogenase formation chaperone [Frankiaceae bacterium]|nr:HypC/HybG/HupF family hydrogenase formation chaperone [Frankiaceae bacterium]
MCLAIPGEVVELPDTRGLAGDPAGPPGADQLALVDVLGVRRRINIGLLEDEELHVGDWILIHVGFAMSKIDEREAAEALAMLELMGQAFTDELDAVAGSSIE